MSLKNNPNLCVVCYRTFSKTSNLRAHVKQFHPEKVNELAPRKLYKPSEYCQACSKAFTNHSNFKRHVLKFHYDKRYTLLGNNLLKHICQICGENFSFFKHLKSHEKLAHDKIKKIFKKSCPLCEFGHIDRSELVSHFESDHNLVINSETIVFNTYEQFSKWKGEIEVATNAVYVKKNGNLNGEKRKYAYFTCQCSGYYRPRGKGIRPLKRQGSNKMNAYCPANIYLKRTKDNCFEALWTQTHVGHDTEESTLSFQNTIIQEEEVDRPLTIEIRNDAKLLEISKEELKNDLIKAVSEIQSMEEVKVFEKVIRQIRTAMAEMRNQFSEKVINVDPDYGVSWYIEQ
ncbi:uncharacterized protein LOC126738101 [Anthonomus grandis grandis]|uniref:uncharacterized protein LOC126738101 n=1 Tax=Anthonomus grandis grandis TaxID=2921223 RepID=UPI002165EBF5|nr:uncharacterized protein LOC126738101 [Anthonomus grandis grandis]